MIKFRTGINVQIIILCILLLLGNAYSSTVLIIAFLYAIFMILKNDSRSNYKLLFFLLPNMRILDDIGINSAVNLIYLLIGLKYVATHRRHSMTAYMAAMALLVWELAHLMCYADIAPFVITVISMAFDLFVFLSLLDDNIIDFKEIINFLAYGCLASAVIFIVSDVNVVNRLITTTYRFEGYGNDPNYFSLYILVALAGLLVCLKDKNNIIWEVIKVFILAFIGFLTASKMYAFCLLGMVAVYFMMIVLQKEKLNFKILGRLFLITAILIAVFHNYVFFYIQKFLRRFNETFYTTTIANFTTGRTENILNYLNILSNDMIGLFLGRGALYYQYYRNQGFSYLLAAHNTYFDILLSGGLSGIIVIVYGWITLVKGKLCTFKEKDKLRYLPLVIYLIAIFALSCYTTDMFWYLLLLVLIPLKRGGKENAG